MGHPDIRVVEALPSSRDTIIALEELLADAKAGNVVGLAYAAMHKAGGYAYHVTGEAADSPTFARGMLACLDDHLAALIRSLL